MTGMARIAVNGWTGPLLEMDEMAVNGLKWFEMVRNGCTWL